MSGRILFILSSTGTGGIVSSYIPLYNYLRGRADVKTILLSNGDEEDFPFSESLISDSLLDIYNGSFSSLSLIKKMGAILLKPYKRLCLLHGNTLSDYVARRISRRLMQKYHFNYVVGFSEGAPTKLASFFTGAKTLSWIHCDYARYFSLTCKKHDELSVYTRLDHIVCVSKYTRSSFISIYPSLEDRVLSINNLLDIERVKTMSREPNDDNRFVCDCFTLISVGRIVPVKRFSLIPKIAKGLKDTGHVFRWYLVGPSCDTKEMDVINERIVHYNVSDSVFCLGRKSNPYTLMANSDILVCLSSSEACPMVFNEAKVLSLPVLTTDFCSASEFIIDNKNGIISPIDHVQKRLEQIMDDKSFLESIKNEVGSTGYSNETILKQLDDLFFTKSA